MHVPMYSVLFGVYCVLVEIGIFLELVQVLRGNIWSVGWAWMTMALN